MRPSIMSLPADVLERLFLFLGAASAPTFCACGHRIVSEPMLVEFFAELAAVAQVLGVPRPCLQRTFRPALYAECCKELLRLVMTPLHALNATDLFYPGFHELSRAYVARSGPGHCESPEAELAGVLALPANAEPFDLTDYLAVDLDLAPDPLDAWLELNAAARQDHVVLQRAIKVLRLGASTYQFYPGDFETGQRPCVLLPFRCCGVVGALAAEEPDVDPAGFYF